ncbi:unnamed protein product [Linum tenue]|uniref:DUF1639 family protein n=1 Tax=Linum tenue TaxID=586396 RepID=A0AAV0H9D0_9ROSI|nr:unnamed protein product [Linum tenue]
MAMPPQERSKTLHNFSLPCLKWGNQRHLKCVKDPPPPDNPLLLLPPPPPPPPPHHRPSSSSAVPNGLIQSRPAIGNPVQHNNATSSPDLGINGGADDPPSSRPWNLRTRRAACKAPLTRPEDNRISNNNGNQKSPRRVFEIDSSSSPPARRQCLDPTPSVAVIRGRPSKLRVPLSKEEIEEDFMEIARIRPPRRPKKRPRIVQKYLDVIFPGLWLTEVTADLYKVPEVPES